MMIERAQLTGLGTQNEGDLIRGIWSSASMGVGILTTLKDRQVIELCRRWWRWCGPSSETALGRPPHLASTPA